MALGGGDKLARGAAKAQFPSNSSISASKWDSIFEEFNADEYRAKVEAEDVERKRRRDAIEESAGDAGA